MNPLYQWYEVSQKLTALKAQELELRKAVFAAYFPEPHEGTNKVEIEGNAVLVANLPYNYSIDEDNIEAGLKHVPKAAQDTIVNWKPSLVKSVYNKLSAKAKKAFAAECVVVTPGTPSLEIKPAASDE